MKISDVDVRAIIERCILRSKYIIMAHAMQRLRKEQDYVLNRMPTATLVSKQCLPELDKEIDVMIDGLKRDTSNMLKPLFHFNDIDIDEKFWFSPQELRDGYVLLSTRQMKKYYYNDRVLLLSDVVITNEKILKGTFISWEKHVDIEDFIPSAIKDKTFLTHYTLKKIKHYDKERN